MDDPTKVTVLAVTTIKDECFVDGCDRPTLAAATYHSRKHHDVVTVWLCEGHGRAFVAPTDATTNVLVHETRTCREETSGRVCGAYATHVRLLGGEWEDGRPAEIWIMAVCEEHARSRPTLAEASPARMI